MAVSKRPRVSDAVAPIKKTLDEQDVASITKMAAQAATKATQAAKSIQTGEVSRILADLKVTLTGTLDGIANEVTAKSQFLNDVQMAIEGAQAQLKELHGITHEANMLEAVIRARHEFEAALEMAKADSERDRKREECDFIYSRDLKRRNEDDQWKQSCIARERAFNEALQSKERALAIREEAVKASEQETIQLRDRVAKFQGELEAAIVANTKEVTDKVTRGMSFEHRLAVKELESQLALRAQTISSLEARVKEMESVVIEAKKSQSEASVRVQTIAEKAIEGAAKAQAVVQVGNGNSEPTTSNRR